MTKNYTIKDERKNVCSINEKVAGYMYAFSAKYNIKKKIRKRKRILHKTIRSIKNTAIAITMVYASLCRHNHTVQRLLLKYM